jgi:Copper amine oxidase N-terminal domain.
MKKRILSLALATCMVISSIFLFTPQAQATSADSILKDVNTFNGKDYTYFNNNYPGKPGGTWSSGGWCSYFVGLCAQLAGLNDGITFPATTSGSTIATAEWFAQNATYYNVLTSGDQKGYGYFSPNSYNAIDGMPQGGPRPGDIAFFAQRQSNGTREGNVNGHMGIVQSYNSGTGNITIYHGSWSSKVALTSVAANGTGKMGTNSQISVVAYARPNYDGTSTAPVQSAPSNISFNIPNGPSGSLTPGAPFYFRGSITSNYNIISATVQIRDANNTVVQEKTVTPNKKTVDILTDGLDSLKFGTLANGSYTMHLDVRDSSGGKAEWSSSFTIGTAPAASTLSINVTSAPSGTLTPGAPFYCRGSITSNYNITSATVYIRTASGTMVQKETVTPDKTNVDILNDKLDSLKFGDLENGSYTFFLIAADSSGKQADYISYFTIGTAPAPTPTPTPAPTPVPTPPPAPVDPYTPFLTEAVISAEGNEDAMVGVKLEWTPVVGITYYRVFRTHYSGQYSYPLTDFAIKGTTFVDVKIQPDTNYYYIVRPLISEGDAWEGIPEELGNISNEVSIFTSAEILEPKEKPEFEKCYILMQIDNPMMDVNGTTIEVDPGRGTAPTLKYSRTVLPIRAVTEAMSGVVGWRESEQRVTLSANENVVEMWLGSMDYTANGRSQSMDIAPFAENNRTFLPLRFAAENLNCQVTWRNETKEILIVFYGIPNADVAR